MAFIALVIVPPAVLAPRLSLVFDASVARPLLGVSMLASLGLWCRFRRLTALEPAIRTSAWGIGLSNAYLPAMYALSRAPSPLTDAQLASWDAALGIRTSSIVAFVASAHLQRVASTIYDLLLPLLALAVIVPPLLGRTRASERFLLAIVLVSIPSFAIYARFQAIGPWVHGDFAPSAPQRACEATIMLARSGAPLVISFSDPGALVAFPSWHAILGTLGALAFSEIPRLRGPAALLGAGIVLSTLATGWHYVSDVLAGVVFALAAHALARWLLGRSDAQSSSVGFSAPFVAASRGRRGP